MARRLRAAGPELLRGKRKLLCVKDDAAGFSNVALRPVMGLVLLGGRIFATVVA